MLAYLANGYYERECQRMSGRLARGAETIETLISGEIISIRFVSPPPTDNLHAYKQFWIAFHKAQDAPRK